MYIEKEKMMKQFNEKSAQENKIFREYMKEQHKKGIEYA